MPFNSLMSRADVQGLIPEQVSKDMLGKIREDSAVLRAFKRVAITTNQERFPILSLLPVAYFVTGDTGLKQTSESNWTNKFLNVEEIAVIVPIPQSVADDLDSSGVDVWEEIKPDIEEAFGRTLDAAVFFGTNAPVGWPTNISAAASAAGNTITEGAAALAGGFHDDVDQLLGLIEADGYDPKGIVAARSARGRFRRARATDGQRLAGLDPEITKYEGLDIVYPMRGLFPAGGVAGSNVRLFVGDWDEYIVGVRQDLTYKMLDQAVIQDNTGAIVYNLAQQDMIALRCVMRVGWQVANRINNDQLTEASRYPSGRLMF